MGEVQPFTNRFGSSVTSKSVMGGLDPSIHQTRVSASTAYLRLPTQARWMAGSSPAMTAWSVQLGSDGSMLKE
jgi:hypothetical protein